MADEDLARAGIEVALLQLGVPYSAIQEAPDDATVLRWFVVATERDRIQKESQIQ